MALTDKHCVNILAKLNLVDSKEVKALLKKAQTENIPLCDFIVEHEVLAKDQLGQAIAKELKVKYINLDSVQPDPSILKLLSKIQAKKYLALAFEQNKDGIHLALSDPAQEEFLKNFTKRVNHPVIVYYADDYSLLRAIEKFYPETMADNTLGESLRQVSTVDKNTKPEDIPIIKIVNKILTQAYINKASDVHIEPYENKTVIRYRIDGILHDIIQVPKSLHDLITTRIKILSRLRTDEHRAAQDGRLRFFSDEQKIDVRVSIVPLIYGEKIVMRLLTEHAKQYDLENLGFSQLDFKKIKNNISKPWGMILVTGPTGSGKTTTLYSILKILNKREVNISTIEDPVEFDIEGVNQIQVNAKTNLTFAAGLRSIVRQDPNIIMVGEIRDQETAKIAINSAMTGHLVLSTLHTNDAPTTLPRLLDMGIQPFLVSSTINIAIGQRLVRQLCQKCKKSSTLTADTIELISKQISPELVTKFKLNTPKTKIYTPQGCTLCQNTGYNGRVGIFEIMELTDSLKKLIMDKNNATVIRQKAIEEGMTTMIEDGLEKVLSGITTIEEVLRVTRV